MAYYFNQIDSLFVHNTTKIIRVIVGVRVFFLLHSRIISVKTAGPTLLCAQTQEIHPECWCKKCNPLMLCVSIVEEDLMLL